MTLAISAPVGWVKVIAVGDATVMRGRPAEFRHVGLALAVRPTPMAALLEVGKDPGALVLVPTRLSAMPVVEFVDVLRSVAHASVIAGVVPGTSTKAVSELFDHGISSTVALPATPSRLAEAVLASRVPTRIDDSVIEVGNLILDNGRHRVTWYGREVVLAPKSFEILRLMMLAYPRVVSLRELVYALESGTDDHAIRIRVAVGRLRAAFADGAPSVGTSMYRGTPIETVPRVGYRLCP